MIRSTLELEKYSYGYDKYIKQKVELRPDEDERKYEFRIDDTTILELTKDEVKELIKYLRLVVAE